ncbi:hypothetical protein IPF86_00305 [Candidatus Nomurabacteria bacterium]|nr:MAG: hypothetical protein IPF86_00305 [Candidatus Nomurabacteria bacterium]
MQKITLKSFRDSNLGLIIWVLGLVFGEILKFIFSPFVFMFSPSRKLAYKLACSKKFVYWRKITRDGSVITVSAHHGHAEKPEFVQIYEFDTSNNTYEEYRNTDNGKQNHIKGTLKVGIKKFT